MANPEHLAILKQGVEAWNKWRLENPQIRPDLGNSHLRELKCAEQTISNERTAVDFNDVNLFAKELYGANFGGASLSGAYLTRAYLATAKFHNANLHHAYLRCANLTGANLVGADLSEVDLLVAELYGANLGGASLRGAYLGGANFSAADLKGADLTGAYMNGTRVAACDLSNTKGLETVVHGGPSSIGIDTLYISRGKIPDKFLRDAGVPEDVIEHLLPLMRTGPPIQWHSCFISHSTKDEEFARRLHARMREAGLRVWFAPEDVKGGDKLYDQISRAIQYHDKLLVVLSESSIKSEWVMTEIRKAREVEKKESRRKLFPIRLVDFNTLRTWTCFDADTGKDLAVEVREYFIPDFSNWKNHDAFEAAFAKLLKDLRAEDSKKA